jgi:hypothetical protein
MPASPLHRVVPGVPSIWMGQPLHHGKSYRTQGSHATAACPPLEAARPIDESDDGFTSASTISTGGFRRLDAASALSAPQSRLAIRPLAAQRSPATISIFSESRVEAARLRKRTAGFLRRDRERSELVIIRTRVADSGCWIILGSVLQMAAISRWRASASVPEPPVDEGAFYALSAG